jgi:DNA polymerase-3 subunit delta'
VKLEKIISSSQDFLSLQQEIKDGKISKSMLLITKDEHYSYEFAILFAAMLFNDGHLIENENYLKVQNLSHPDLKIYPQKDKIMVADSDNIVEESSIKPIFANKKVFILRNIDQGTEQAQNKLLKTLEEPAHNVYFILTTSNINQVLPTIRSRCNKIELAKLPKELISRLCEGDELVAALSDGYAGRAMTLASNENLHKLFDSTLAVVSRLKSSKNLLSFSKDLASFKNEFDLVVEIMSLIFEDMLFVKVGKLDKVKFKNHLSVIKECESEYSIKAIAEIRKLLDGAVKEMLCNCNFTLVLENLLLNILEVKYICR